MKFTVYTSDIRDALKAVVKCVAPKPQVEILAGVKITAEKDKVTLAATDHQIAAACIIPANVEVEGTACVDAKYLFNMVCKISDDTATFTADEKSFGVFSGSAKFTLLVFDPQEYPSIKFPTGNALKVRAPLLKEIIRKTLFAVSKTDDRPLFKGVNIVSKVIPDEGTILQAYSTDTYRIAAFLGGRISSVDSPEFNVVVPTKILACVAAELDNDPENTVEVICEGSWLGFKFDNLFYKTRIIEGEFPNVSKTLDVQSSITATFHTREMKSALDAAKIISGQSEYKSVKLSLGENCITVAADRPDCGNFSTLVEAECSGELEIAFNIDYLIDFLNAINCTRTKIRLNGKFDPVAMCDAADGSGDFVYVVTPVRV